MRALGALLWLSLSLAFVLMVHVWVLEVGREPGMLNTCMMCLLTLVILMATGAEAGSQCLYLRQRRSSKHWCWVLIRVRLRRVWCRRRVRPMPPSSTSPSGSPTPAHPCSDPFPSACLFNVLVMALLLAGALSMQTPVSSDTVEPPPTAAQTRHGKIYMEPIYSDEDVETQAAVEEPAPNAAQGRVYMETIYNEEEVETRDAVESTPSSVLAKHANLTNVWVLEVGSERYPGDVFIKDIATRKVRQICFPHAFVGPFAPKDFPNTVFLKPSPTGVDDQRTLGYGTVAISFNMIVDYSPTVGCACHDEQHMLCLTFEEIRRMSPVRVSYTNGSGPYALPAGDEAERLLAALETAAYVEDPEARRARVDAAREVRTNKYGLTVYSKQRVVVDKGVGTRALERNHKRKQRLDKLLVGVPFISHRDRGMKDIEEDVCCEGRNCSYVYCVSNERQEGLDRVVWYRNRFQSLDEQQRRHFINSRILYESAGENTETHRRWVLESPAELSMMVRAGTSPRIAVAAKATTRVCGDFFCYVLGVSKNKLFQPTVGTPVFQTSVPRTSIPRNSETPGKSFYVQMWLLNLAKFYLHDPTAERILLPFADKRTVYDMYMNDCEDLQTRAQWAPLGTVSRQWFYSAWNSDIDCKLVKVRKTLKFSLCADCVKFIETRQHVLSDEERKVVKAQESAHHMFVRGERGSYYQRRQAAVSDPRTCFSIIIDGADQSAFGSPHHCNHSKADDGHWKIGTHLMGAMVHGRTAHGFTMLPNIKHGSNVSIETLHRVLLYEYLAGGRKIFAQKTMYLQLDNTTKQCKSQFVLGYLGLLVAWRLFVTVIVSFLPVGHTHEDIDQFFSRIAIWLRKHNATSRIGFKEAIVNAFKGKWTGNVAAADIDRAANISDWIAPLLNPMGNINDGPQQRHGITKFHQFKLSLLQGVVIMQVREWCADLDAPWTGLVPGSTHHVLFKDLPPSPADLVRECPPAQRSTLPTNPEYMEKNKNGDILSNHTSKTRKGVEKIIENMALPARTFTNAYV